MSKVFKQIQKGIDTWLHNGDPTLLYECKDGMMEHWWDLATDLEDYRPGVDTYGYADKESIKLDMEYISDRWGTPARLKWIIDGLEDGHFDK